MKEYACVQDIPITYFCKGSRGQKSDVFLNYSLLFLKRPSLSITDVYSNFEKVLNDDADLKFGSIARIRKGEITRNYGEVENCTWLTVNSSYGNLDIPLGFHSTRNLMEKLQCESPEDLLEKNVRLYFLSPFQKYGIFIPNPVLKTNVGISSLIFEKPLRLKRKNRLLVESTVKKEMGVSALQNLSRMAEKDPEPPPYIEDMRRNPLDFPYF